MFCNLHIVSTLSLANDTSVAHGVRGNRWTLEKEIELAFLHFKSIKARPSFLFPQFLNKIAPGRSSGSLRKAHILYLANL